MNREMHIRAHFNLLRAVLICLAFMISAHAQSAAISPAVKPVTPNASPEAVELLNYLYNISGNHTLAGQHAVPLLRTARLIEAQRAGGHFPALFGMDFGFDSPGTWDGMNFRQNIVDDAIQKSRGGLHHCINVACSAAH